MYKNGYAIFRTALGGAKSNMSEQSAKVMHCGQYSRGKCVMMKLLLDETARESLPGARAQEGGVAVVNNKASFTVGRNKVLSSVT